MTGPKSLALHVRKTAKKPTSRSDPRASRDRRGGGRARASGVAEGDVPVRAYIAALPSWRRELAQRFDALVAREVPQVRRAIKWGLPFYGLKDRGWFVSCGAIGDTLKITFFQGASLKPVPPSRKGRQLGGVDVGAPAEFDEAQLASWVAQAAKLPGYGS